ncbi:NAD(P)/FAD-dependent oxidoreductase [Streptomyces abyssomicinicus]|uniref:NAD(P)/FAD-dependent oxidoreductase n=1 Tax=Streptomyces abyssomicinicus TaxID=574929 RepID=UPI0012505A7A|nr:FAD-dependent oxidoreductase [Streptomyces abyssomicinicus]
MSTVDRVLIVGGGLAAVSLADALRSGGHTGDIVILSAEDHLPYDRPPLSKDVLLGRSGLEDIRLRPDEWYERVDFRTDARVASLDPDAGRVTLADGSEVTGDRIVLATGGVPRTPGGDPAVHVLRVWEDAERLRPRLVPGARVAVVGAGLIGAESAAVAAALGCEVTLIDPTEIPLLPVVGPEIATVLHARHAEAGIRCLNGGVESIERDGEFLRVAVTGLDEPVTADTVIAGIGIVPDTALAEAAGLTVDNGVVVDAGYRTSHPSVYAIGDVARRADEPRRHEHWDHARTSAERAAATLLGQDAPAQKAGWFWSDRHGSRLEGVGTMADAETRIVRGDAADGAFTVFGVAQGRLVAAAAIDRPRDIQAARRLVGRELPVDAAALADPATDLRKLLRARPVREER